MEEFQNKITPKTQMKYSIFKNDETQIDLNLIFLHSLCDKRYS